MGLFKYLKNVKEAYQEIKEKGPGFPVDLEAPFLKFMLDVKDGDHYLGLDTNFLVDYKVFIPEFRSIRFVISQHTVYFLENSLKNKTEHEQIAFFTLNKIGKALEDGFKISFMETTEEHIKSLGLEMTYSSTVFSSFHKAQKEIERIHNDWRKLYIITTPNSNESIQVADHLGLPIYTVKD